MNKPRPPRTPQGRKKVTAKRAGSKRTDGLPLTITAILPSQSLAAATAGRSVYPTGVAADTPESLPGPAPREEMPEPNEKGITGEEKNEILKDYLKGILGQKTGAIIMDGAGVGLKTPAARPKTVEEAGRLFRGILD